MTSYCVRFLCRHLREGCCWEELGRLLADVRFLRRKQEPAAQLGLEEEILDLLADEEAPMERVLEGIASAIMDGMELSREKADWLDTLAYWMGSAKPAGDERRREGLKRVAIELDEACGEVSRDLAEKYLNEGELDSAMRFAELRTWVCQRRGDYRALVDACDAGEAMCRTEQVAAGYRTLGLSEFIRMRAYALTHLAGTAGGDGKDVRARVAPEFDELSRVFAEIGTEGWRLSREEWLALQERGAGGFALSHRRSRDDSMTFKANVVSNEHDAIGAMYLIQVLESRGGFVNWIHHKDFEPGQLDQEGARLTVLLGGPKTPDFSDVAHRFYESDRDAYLRMYSGLHFGPIALKLVDEETRSVAFMLGGASKLHTLQAVHDFANSDEVTHIIG